MKITWAAASILLLAVGSAGAGEKPQWMKFDQAIQVAKATGKPVCVWATVDEKGGGC